MKSLLRPDRRGLLTGIAGALVSLPAQSAILTPRQTAGPFYPEKIPNDSDMDLSQFNGGIATGEIIEVSGNVFSQRGHPLPGTIVELWQANTYGRYHHSGDDSLKPRDPHFQGFGAVKADKDGAYRFRTVLPGLYPGRTRHIHFRLVQAGRTALVTQMYFPDEEGNSRDGLYQWLKSDKAKAAATAKRFAQDQPSRLVFDIVLA